MAAQALRRRAKLDNWEELAFERVRPGVAELLARTTLRPAPGGTGFELCCPPAHEAQMYEWVIATNLETLRCPSEMPWSVSAPDLSTALEGYDGQNEWRRSPGPVSHK